MTESRTIIHLDLDAFFCSVEELQNPELRGKAFAVGGKPNERGVVSSCSYPARLYGVRSAMPMANALRLCQSLIVLPANHKLYSQISHQIMEMLTRFTPLVEQVSIDEAFLDITSLDVIGDDSARHMQNAIKNEFCLPCSLGVATNKLVAKIANDVGKSRAQGTNPPNAITVVPIGQEEQFLAPLPVIALYGVGPKTASRLKEIGVSTIGELSMRTPEELRHIFGKIGLDLWLHSRGIDETPVVTSHDVKSISQEVTFSRDVTNKDTLSQTISELSTMVGQRLRQAKRSGSTVKLKIRWPDFTTITRQISFIHPIDQDREINSAALLLFEKNWRPGMAVRLIGVGITGLKYPSLQLGLFEPAAVKEQEGIESDNPQLKSAIEELRKRFGQDVIQTANQLLRAETNE